MNRYGDWVVTENGGSIAALCAPGTSATKVKNACTEVSGKYEGPRENSTAGSCTCKNKDGKDVTRDNERNIFQECKLQASDDDTANSVSEEKCHCTYYRPPMETTYYCMVWEYHGPGKSLNYNEGICDQAECNMLADGSSAKAICNGSAEFIADISLDDRYAASND